MNKNLLRTLLAIYAGCFTLGFVYSFQRELRKEMARNSYTPSPEFQKLVNHYNNKEKDLANA